VAAAAMLVRECPDAREDALAEPRAQSDDGFLTFVWRTDAMFKLAQADAPARTDIATRYGSIFDDERQTLWNRCEAAYQMVELDESQAGVAMAALRRFTTSTRFAIEDRWFAVYQFARLCHQGLAAEVNELGWP
jgi:cellulose synthase operon protein C